MLISASVSQSVRYSSVVVTEQGNIQPLSATLDCWADNNNRRPLQIRRLSNLSFQSYAKVNPPFSVGVLVLFAVERLAAAKSRTLSNLQQTPTRASFIEFPYGFAFLIFLFFLSDAFHLLFPL